MNKPLLYSRVLQFSIVLSFLLPFFIVGCQGGEKSDESAAAADSTAADTTLSIVSDTLNDSFHTLSKDTIDKDTTQEASQNINEKPDDSTDKPLSVKLADAYPILKPLLYSIITDPSFEGISFTGIALIINALEHFMIFCIIIAWLLIISCLVIKFLDQSAIRTHLFLNLFALLFLYIYIPGWDYKIRFGFWACIALIVSAVALDAYRLLMHKKISFNSLA